MLLLYFFCFEKIMAKWQVWEKGAEGEKVIFDLVLSLAHWVLFFLKNWLTQIPSESCWNSNKSTLRKTIITQNDKLK